MVEAEMTTAKQQYTAARNAAELAACQKIVGVLPPEILAAAANAAAAHGIKPSDISALGFCLDPKNAPTGALEKTVRPWHGKYRSLLKAEQNALGVEKLKELAAAEHLAAVAANNAYLAASQPAPVYIPDTDGMGDGDPWSKH